MGWVVFALLPAILVQCWFYGIAYIAAVFVTVASACLFEALCLKLREQNIATTLSDLSAVVTALLIIVSLPPLSPWWLGVTASAVAIILVKQIYGGLGYNLFNPAMAAYAVLIISFPGDMTVSVSAEILQQSPWSLAEQWAVFSGAVKFTSAEVSAYTGATSLDAWKTALTQNKPTASIDYLTLTNTPQYYLNLAYLFGGGCLIWNKIISWHIPIAFVSSLALLASLFHQLDPNQYPSTLFHLFSGATWITAFFILTDPVTAATSTKGRLLFAALAAILVFSIRSWGGYPEGAAFAVLLANIVAPTIDRYTTPRVFGR